MNNPLSCGLDPVGFKASAVTLVEGTSTFVPEMLLHSISLESKVWIYSRVRPCSMCLLTTGRGIITTG